MRQQLAIVRLKQECEAGQGAAAAARTTRLSCQ